MKPIFAPPPDLLTRFDWDRPMSHLYALAIGIEPDGSAEQCYLMDACSEAFPAFATVIAREGGLNAPALDLDLAGVVLARLCVEFRADVPVQGQARVESRVEAMADNQERGAKLWIVTDIGLNDGTDKRAIASVCQELHARNDGGRGGFGKCPAPQPPVPAVGDCDRIKVPGNLAHLFRLLGDRNPLHVDSATATRLGLRGPILHGQALFGLLARRIHRHSGAMARLDVRFTAPVYPGEELEFWSVSTDEGGAFRCNDTELRCVAEGFWHSR